MGEELRRKAEALAQRTILENFELREMVNELRDENFHLRNEIYELQDKINRQVLQINKLEKHAGDAPISHTDMGTGMMMPYDDDIEDDDMDNDIYANLEDEDDDGMGGMMDDFMDEHVENNNNHDRAVSITGNDWMSNTTSKKKLAGRRESKPINHISNSDEARAKRIERAGKHERKESVKPPNLFDDPDSDYIDEDALQKQQERSTKQRKASIATPDIYGDQQGSTEEDESEEDDDAALNLSSTVPTTGTKRRGSKIYMDADAIKKREERQKKHHRRESSIATPNIFRDNYDAEKLARDKAKANAPDAIKKRLARRAKKVGAAAVKYVKSHRRKESLAEKLLLGPQDFGMDVGALSEHLPGPVQTQGCHL